MKNSNTVICQELKGPKNKTKKYKFIYQYSIKNTNSSKPGDTPPNSSSSYNSRPQHMPPPVAPNYSTCTRCKYDTIISVFNL